MKKLFVLLLVFSFFLVGFVHADHSISSASLSLEEGYEFAAYDLVLHFENNGPDALTEVRLLLEGVNGGDFVQSGSFPVGSVDLPFTVTLASVGSDTSYFWTLETSDSNGSSFTDLAFTVLNDDLAPSPVDVVPGNYAFVSAASFPIRFSLEESGSGLEDSAVLRYDDNPLPLSRGNEGGSSVLSCSGLACETSFDLSLISVNAPYVDFRIENLSDLAGNTFVDSPSNNYPYHYYIDMDDPLFSSASTDNGSLNNKLYYSSHDTLIGFRFRVNDSSLFAVAPYNPSLSCFVSFRNGSPDLVYGPIRKENTLSDRRRTSSLNRFEDGRADWQITCEDKAGHVSTRDGPFFIVDRVAPSLSLISHENGDVVSSSDTLVFNFSDVTSGVSSYRISLDGNFLSEGLDSSVAVSPSWSEGSHILSVEVSDLAGNTASEDFTFIVDISAPLLTLLSPDYIPSVYLPLTDGFSLFNLSYDNLGDFEFSFVADDAVSDLSCTLVLQSGGNEYSAEFENVVAGATHVALLSDLSLDFGAGVYDWFVQCSDGPNLGESEVRSFILDNEAPVFTSFSPASASWVSGIVAFDYSLSDAPFGDAAAGGNPALSLCELLIDGVVVDSSAPSDIINNTFTSRLSDGAYSFDIRCADQFANVASLGPQSLYVDSTLPLVSVDLSANILERETDTLLLNWTYFDDNLDEENVGLIIYPFGDPSPFLRPVFNASVQGDYSLLARDFGVGTYSLLAYALDQANNPGMSGFVPAFEVVDTLAPRLVSGSQSPTQGQSFDAGTSSVSLNFSTSEESYCLYTSTTDITSFNFSSFDWDTNSSVLEAEENASLTHHLDVATSNGQTYTYFFVCSDLYGNAANSNDFFNMSFSISNPPDSPGGSGGGGGRDRNSDDEVIDSTLSGGPLEDLGEEETTEVFGGGPLEEASEETREEQNNGFTPFTANVIRAVGKGLRSKPAIVLYSLAGLSILGYGVNGFLRRRKGLSFY